MTTLERARRLTSIRYAISQVDALRARLEAIGYALLEADADIDPDAIIDLDIEARETLASVEDATHVATANLS